MGDILVVDDERVVRDGLKALLSGEGFAVRTAHDGADALGKFAERRPDLVLLDVMMPKMNGFVACGEIRKLDRGVPVVFLTAKDSEADQVRGFGLGADDYVSKDAPEAVLVARVRRAIDRCRDISRGAGDGGRRIRVGQVSANTMSLEVSSEGRAVARLTKTEADILRVLDSDRGRVFSSDELIAALRGEGFACEDTMLYVHVSNLRRKLGPAASLLQTTRGAGYRLMP